MADGIQLNVKIFFSNGSPVLGTLNQMGMTDETNVLLNKPF